MKSNDLTNLWNVLQQLRDACTDPMLKAIMELAMTALMVERDGQLDDAEPGADPDR